MKRLTKGQFNRVRSAINEHTSRAIEETVESVGMDIKTIRNRDPAGILTDEATQEIQDVLESRNSRIRVLLRDRDQILEAIEQITTPEH